MKKALLVGLVILGLTGRAAAADFTVTPSGQSSWTINGLQSPTLTLTRGRTYTFAVNAPGHPFAIKSDLGDGSDNEYVNGVTNEGTSGGTLTFAVPLNAPNPLYYQCEAHFAMWGQLTIVSPPPSVPAGTSITYGLLGVGLALAAFALLRRAASSARTA